MSQENVEFARRGYAAINQMPRSESDRPRGVRVVVPIHFGGKARCTGMEVAFAVVHVVTVRDGRCARTDMFREKAEAPEAVGLRE